MRGEPEQNAAVLRSLWTRRPAGSAADQTLSPPPGVLPCSHPGCAAQTGSACGYEDKRGRQCPTAWCPEHRDVVRGGVYCRRHSGIVEALSSSISSVPMPDLDNRAASLVRWVGRDLDPLVRELLDRRKGECRIAVSPVHPSYVGFQRSRAWQWAWRREGGSMAMAAETVAIHVEERRDDTVVISVCSWVAASLTPPWIEQRRRGAALTPAEDEAMRADFYRTILYIISSAFRELEQRGLAEVGAPVGQGAARG